MPKKEIEWGNIPMKGEEYADKLTIQYLSMIESGKDANSRGQLSLNGKKSINKMNKKNKEKNHWDKLSKQRKGKKRNEQTKNKIKQGTKHSWRPILQYTKDGKFLKEWPNFTAIRDELELAHTNICNCCKHYEYKKKGIKTSYGFIWKYKK